MPILIAIAAVVLKEVVLPRTTLPPMRTPDWPTDTDMRFPDVLTRV